LIVQAIVKCGTRDYASSEMLLNRAENLAEASGDDAAACIAWAAHARLHNSQGAFDLTLARPCPTDLKPEWLLAEITSCYAVAYAAVGEADRALAIAAAAEEATLSGEVRTNGACARAIVALRVGDLVEGFDEARIALRAAIDSGAQSCFVSAYRGCPELILALLTDAATGEQLTRLMTVIGDDAALSRVTPSREGSIESLSPRERQVLALLSQGQSNREIAGALYISSATVKVHVRHIFDKLGVKSRTEAALRGWQFSR
jgi:ATP/maltotriose-dependent transcriptional regulator MalT